MRYLDQFLFISAILSVIAAATPIRRTEAFDSLQKRDRFTIHQTKSRNVKRSGPEALAKAHKKFTPMPHGYRQAQSSSSEAIYTATSTSSAPASTSTESGDSDPNAVTATPSSGDDEYTAVVSIGNNDFHLDFDTGSSDLWVYSNELPTSEQSRHNVYSPTSTSKLLEGNTWAIKYGDGSSASGDVYTEDVSIGAATVIGQAIELASNISTQFQNDFNNDGLLGLAFDSLNNVSPNQQKTFFSNVKDSLAEPLFTADLRHQEPGSYDFGFVNSSKYAGELVYLPADSSRGFWGIDQTGYQIGGDGSSLTSKAAGAIVDSGTTLLLMTEDVVSAYYSQVSGSQNSTAQGGFIFSCRSQLPDLFIGFQGYTARVDSQYLNFSAADQADMCYGGLQASSPGARLEVILGDIFLKSVFTVFKAPSGENPSLGFALKTVGAGGGAVREGKAAYPLSFLG